MSFQDQQSFRDPNQQELPYADAARRDNRLQPDPEMAEGTVGTGRIAMTLVAGAFLVAVVLYGLNAQRTEVAQEPSDAAQTQAASGPTQGQNAQQDASTKSAPVKNEPSTTGQGGDKSEPAAGSNKGSNAAPAQNAQQPTAAKKPQQQ